MSVVTQAALVDMIGDILAAPCTLRLYVNESLPDEPTASDFQEPEGGGYVTKPMRFQSWDLSQAPEDATYPVQVWTFTGPAGLVQGYFVTRNSDGRLRWYDPLSGGPMRIVNDGDQIKVSVSFEFEPEDDAEEAAEGETVQ